jgi:hypothetical protein
VGTRARILELASRMYPPILNKDGGFDVIRDIVGRRPAKKQGLRLEVEKLRGQLQGKKVVHAYGAGGSGFALSWGVAEVVVKMVLDPLEPHVVQRAPL